MSEPVGPAFTAALDQARADLREAEARYAAKFEEYERVNTLIRRLRAVIHCLAQQLGEPDGLEPEPEQLRRRGVGRRTVSRPVPPSKHKKSTIVSREDGGPS